LWRPVERAAILADGDLITPARHLGITRVTLRAKIRRSGLD
jgi:DNA-binding protein Fis